MKIPTELNYDPANLVDNQSLDDLPHENTNLHITQTTITEAKPEKIAKLINAVLRRFQRHKAKLEDKVIPKSYPTHKNLRVCLIRGHKRMMRNILYNKSPKKKMDLFDNENEAQILAKNAFEDFTLENQKFKKLCKTKNGPKSDGKFQRDVTSDCSVLLKSHNKQFRDIYFSDPNTITSFRLYIDCLFSSDSAQMCEKFDFSCCEGPHLMNCQEKWSDLSSILKEKLV